MDKSLEERIYETREIIKQVIAEEQLNPAVVELILHELYLDARNVSLSAVQSKIIERENKDKKEE